MTQEEKQLLLIDLCARLSYRVKGRIYAETAIIGEYDIDSGHQLYEDTAFIAELNAIDIYEDIIHVTAVGNNDAISFIDEQQDWGEPYTIEGFEPYLRPMSSMTEEEKKHWKCISIGCPDWDFTARALDWLNSHHFDYRDLISKGLALEAPEGMYTISSESTITQTNNIKV